MVLRNKECVPLLEACNDFVDLLCFVVVYRLRSEELGDLEIGICSLKDELGCSIRVCDWAKILGLLRRKNDSQPELACFAQQRIDRAALSERQVMCFIKDAKDVERALSARLEVGRSERGESDSGSETLIP